MGRLHEIWERFGDRVDFVVVYIREAHPEDGWVVTPNRNEDIRVHDPTTDAERHEVAASCALRLKIRMPVVVDGFISAAGALIAAALCPSVKAYLIASHLSVERGHGPLWETLGLRPLLDMDLRLGEGTGAALSMHMIEAACRVLGEMATFADAGVSGPAD